MPPRLPVSVKAPTISWPVCDNRQKKTIVTGKNAKDAKHEKTERRGKFQTATILKACISVKSSIPTWAASRVNKASSLAVSDLLSLCCTTLSI